MFYEHVVKLLGFSGGSMVKNPPAMQEMWVGTLGWGNPPWEGNGNPLQCFCLGNPMDRRAWWVQSMELQRVGHDWAHIHLTLTNSMLKGVLTFTWSLLTISDAPHILECISRQREVKNTPHGAYSWWGLFEGKLPGCTQTKWWHKMVSEKKKVSESERKWKWSRSVVSDSVTPWTVAHQAPLSMGFFRQEY